MNHKRNFMIQTFVAILILNGALLGSIFYLAQAYISQNNLAPSLFGIGGAVTLLLWLTIVMIGGKKIATATTKTPQKSEPKTNAPDPQEQQAPAIQMLAILQRKGRLIDFLQENLGDYDDAQIGAAVRSVHEGCQKALKEYVKLEPIYNQEEGSDITVPEGFNAHEVRLIGNVVGNPPFKGALQHRGWRVAKIDLPKLTQEVEKAKVLAAAEVEVV